MISPPYAFAPTASSPFTAPSSHAFAFSSSSTAFVVVFALRLVVVVVVVALRVVVLLVVLVLVVVRIVVVVVVVPRVVVIALARIFHPSHRARARARDARPSRSIDARQPDRARPLRAILSARSVASIGPSSRTIRVRYRRSASIGALARRRRRPLARRVVASSRAVADF